MRRFKRAGVWNIPSEQELNQFIQELQAFEDKWFGTVGDDTVWDYVDGAISYADGEIRDCMLEQVTGRLKKLSFFRGDLLEYFHYLDGLRESGVTNMFGAAPYLVNQYGIESNIARDVLSLWMETFDDSSVEDRVDRIL